MDLLIILIVGIVVVVIGIIGTVLFWGGIAVLGVKAAQNYQQQLDSMMRDYTSTLSDLHATYGDDIPPEVQQKIYAQYMQTQTQLGQLGDLSRQKHDLFVSDMMGQASSIGIDVSSWN